MSTSDKPVAFTPLAQIGVTYVGASLSLFDPVTITFRAGARIGISTSASPPMRTLGPRPGTLMTVVELDVSSCAHAPIERRCRTLSTTPLPPEMYRAPFDRQ